MRTQPTWCKVRPTSLHSFNAARTEARQRDGKIDWVCIKTRRGWFRTDEYEYADETTTN